jgi:hypothetical protein
LYNLLMRAMSGWDETPYELERSRCVHEHTTDAIEERFQKFDDAAVRELRSFPCLFTYESGGTDPARVGWITGIRTRANSLVIEYKFEELVPPIPATEITKLMNALDIGKMEIYRAHWAVKDVDLFPVLIRAGLIGAGAISLQPPGREPRMLGLHMANMVVSPKVFRIPTNYPDPNLVSVMMPFGPEFNGVYASIIASCDALSLTCQRADKVWEHSEVIQDVFSLIFRSRFVVCDFTGQNPNVFYEAGVAHTLGRPVIPISQNKSDVPFDLQHHRYVRYLANAEGLKELSGTVTGRLRTLLDE